MAGCLGERRNRRLVSLLAAAALIGLLALASLLTGGSSPAHAAHAKTRIIFDANRQSPDDYNILSVKPNGSHVRTLTRNSASDFEASASPNGKRIAFVSDRDGNAEIFIMHADGSHERQLTHTSSAPSSVDHEFPAFTANGKKIVFDSNRDGDYEIYVMRTNGTHVRQLTHNDDNDYGPAGSPSGKKIAFNSDRDGDQEIFVMKANGRRQRQITHNHAEDELPAYFPNGKKIAFDSDRDGNEEIFTMKANGRHQRQLTHTSSTATARGASLRGGTHPRPGIATPADAGTRGVILPGPVTNDGASVSPNGRKIAFDSDRDGGDFDIFTMKASGRHQRQLTHNDDAQDEYPDWLRLR